MAKTEEQKKEATRLKVIARLSKYYKEEEVMRMVDGPFYESGLSKFDAVYMAYSTPKGMAEALYYY